MKDSANTRNPKTKQPAATPPVIDWNQVAATDAFRELIAAKVRFLVPAVAFFIGYYFALPVLVGWWPALMATRVGPVNLAYLFALSQFFMAWGLAFLYLRRAARFDAQARTIVQQLDGTSHRPESPQ